MSLNQDTLINNPRLKDKIFQSLMSIAIWYNENLNYKRHVKYLEDHDGEGFRIYRPEDGQG